VSDSKLINENFFWLD